VIELTGSMQRHSSFLRNKTDTPQGDTLGQIKPLFNYSFNSLNSIGPILIKVLLKSVWFLAALGQWKTLSPYKEVNQVNSYEDICIPVQNQIY
jgi:hypothetical protein